MTMSIIRPQTQTDALTFMFLNHRATTTGRNATRHLLEVNVIVHVLIESTKQPYKPRKPTAATHCLNTHHVNCSHDIHCRLWVSHVPHPLYQTNQQFLVQHIRICFQRGRQITYMLCGSCSLTLSPPILLRLYTLPYWSNPPFLIFDIWALWRSGLSARVPECQKLIMLG